MEVLMKKVEKSIDELTRKVEDVTDVGISAFAILRVAMKTRKGEFEKLLEEIENEFKKFEFEEEDISLRIAVNWGYSTAINVTLDIIAEVETGREIRKMYELHLEDFKKSEYKLYLDEIRYLKLLKELRGTGE